jgi:hypothetical protein
MTQFSAIGVPPGEDGEGYVKCGPLLVRSARTTKRTPRSPASVAVAAYATATAEVAQAWEIMGPLMEVPPRRAATVGAP